MKMFSCLFAAVMALVLISPVQAADEGETLKLGEAKKITVVTPKEWVKKKPASNIVEYEFAIPKADGDPADGRVTVMGAGGTVEANIERWIGQFEDGAGKPLAKAKAKIDKTKIDGLEVHVVDLKGTFKDSPGGPFAGGKPVLRDNYRMMGVIVIGGDQGNYFIKAYGPAKTMDAGEKSFTKMVEGIKGK